jgi:hypothetical protein
LLDDDQRMTVPARLFGVALTTRIELFVFGIPGTLSADYTGGCWDMHSLSNGGYYTAHTGDERYQVRCENGYEGTMPGDALGIVCCLYAYSHLSFAGPRELAEECARQYHWLREYMLSEHAEAREILAAID